MTDPTSLVPFPLKVRFQANAVSSTPTTLEAFVVTRRTSPALVTLASWQGLPDVASVTARAREVNLISGREAGVHVSVHFLSPLQQAHATGAVELTLWQPDHGGHVGFPQGRFPGHVLSLPQQVGQWLLDHC